MNFYGILLIDRKHHCTEIICTYILDVEADRLQASEELFPPQFEPLLLFAEFP